MAGQSKCVSSQYNIFVKPGSYAHQHDVEIVFYPATAGRNPRTLTRGGDALQKDRCRHILKNFDPLRRIVYAYDGQACLWTARALDDKAQNVRFEMDEYLRGSLGDDGFITVSFTYVRSIDLSDLSNYAQHVNDATEDRTLRNVLEMILSQDAIERQHNRYTGIGPGFLCQVAEANFDRGFVIRNGCSKGVHVVKSSHGPQLLLAISNSKKVFYPSGVHVVKSSHGPQLLLAISNSKKIFYPSGMNFLDALRNFMGNQFNYAEAESAFRGVKFQLAYNPGRVLTFRRFSGPPLRDITCNIDGHEISVEEYLLQTYNVTLQFPDYKGAMMSNGDAVFPLEQLIIVPDQPVPDNRLPAQILESSLRINRLSPAQRHDGIAEQVRLLEMNNPVTHGFGVRIETEMIKGTFTRLNKVAIIARHNQRLFSNDFGVFKFDKNHYLIPGRVNRLIVLSSERDARTSMDCARATVAECRRKGTMLPDPEHQVFNTQTRNMNEWVAVLEQYARKKILVFVVDSGTESHALIKLAEALTGVPTQHILSRTAANAGRQFQTLENITHKINLKTGGLNHAVEFDCEALDLNRGNVLVIGLDVCHPTGEQHRGQTSEPSFAESVDPVQLRAKTFEMLERASTHRKIDTVVLTRDGISEGQYNMALTTELDAIQQACNEYFKHTKTSIHGIVVTKSGNVRTAKAVLVTAIRNDLNIRESDLQNFLMSLTSLHQIVYQIVCAPISLPEPIYQADKLAQRGQLVFRTFSRFFPQDIPREGGGQNGPIQFPALTNRLAFNEGALPFIRYTA
uniref:Piwi domain-containing protein n=1 Tax=Panagrolaimus sp. PS1159 TaxID=55785 RepID=A0AC35FVL6_9BILA